MDDKITTQNKKLDMLETAMKEIKELKVEISTLKADKIELMKRVKIIEEESGKAKSAQLRNQIEIRGLPKFEGEEALNQLMSLAKATKVALQEDEVEDCYRLPERANKQNVLIIKMKSEKRRDNLMKDLKQAKPTFECLGKEPVSTKIYINEVLTKERKYLLYRVRQLSREKKWYSVWTFMGEVYIAMERGGNKVRISSLEDLDTLCK